MSNKIKGVWVDGGVWEHEPFSLLEKHLFQKISDLDNDKGCTAMNAWFADFLGISKSRVSQLISGFKKANLIKVDLKYKGKEIVGRVINLKQGGMFLIKEGVFQQNTPISQDKHPPLAGSEVSNIVLSNRVKEYKERERKALSENKLLQSENEKLKAEILELKNLDILGFINLKNEKKENQKSCAKKGKPFLDAEEIEAINNGEYFFSGQEITLADLENLEETPKRTFPDNAPRKTYEIKPPPTEEEAELQQPSKPYEMFLNNYRFEGWSDKLKENFLMYCEVKHEYNNGKFSSAQLKMRLAEINTAIEKHEIIWIEKLVLLAANGSKGGWVDFQFDTRIKSRKEKEQKADIQKNDDGTPSFMMGLM